MLLLLEGARDTMNSKELNVNVPLATVESDSEEFEVRKISPTGMVAELEPLFSWRRSRCTD